MSLEVRVSYLFFIPIPGGSLGPEKYGHVRLDLRTGYCLPFVILWKGSSGFCITHLTIRMIPIPTHMKRYLCRPHIIGSYNTWVPPLVHILSFIFALSYLCMLEIILLIYAQLAQTLHIGMHILCSLLPGQPDKFTLTIPPFIWLK